MLEEDGSATDEEADDEVRLMRTRDILFAGERRSSPTTPTPTPTANASPSLSGAGSARTRHFLRHVVAGNAPTTPTDGAQRPVVPALALPAPEDEPNAQFVSAGVRPSAGPEGLAGWEVDGW